ncbi:MAG: S41 family peptidase [Pseudomonadota bacterium]
MLILLFGLGACGGGGSGGGGNPGSGAGGAVGSQAFPAPHSQCSLSQAREEVLEIFEDLYFFNTDPAQVARYSDIRANLSSYGSVDALLDDLRFGPDRTRGFSYFSTVEEVEQFFSAGEFFGFGFSVGIEPTSAWRLIDVFGGSPADLAGMSRGDTLLTVNGVATSGLDLNNPGTFGPPDAGVQRTIRFRKPDGSETEVTLTKTTVDLDPVPPSRVRVFEVGGRYVGYLFFRTFIEDADALLRSAMAELQAQAIALGGIGIDDLIVDLRYNGGGLVATAEVIGSLMAGNARAGQVFFTYEYNDLVTTQIGDPNNDVRRFRPEAQALEGLESVYYITDQASASASELLISDLNKLNNDHILGIIAFRPTEFIN